MDFPNLSSTLTSLTCPECGSKFEADQIQTICQDCQSPLLAQYDLDGLRGNLTTSMMKSRPSSLWRWAELLPVRTPSNRLTLGEGQTPLLQAPRLSQVLGIRHLFIKDEALNPTGTFKARGLAVAVSRAIELGITSFVIPTAGNAGGALAAYTARARCEAHIFMPKDAPLVNQQEARAFGATLRLVDGLINDAARLASQEKASAEEEGDNWFDVSTFKEPYRLEGKKTMGYEIAEDFGWKLPDVIIYPTGGGTGLVGMWKAFDELEYLGWIDSHRPRMVSVQAKGCAPLVRAFQNHADRVKPWENAKTLAAGLRVPVIFADRLVLRALYNSHGIALSVSDQEITDSQIQMANLSGIFAAPEGAATLAALRKLLAQGWVGSDERIVLFNTGNGLKYVS